MKQLEPSPLKDKYWRTIEKKINRIFLDMVYRELFAATRKQIELYNAVGDPLADAILSATISYKDGVFSGKFSSKTTKELRKIGAKYHSPSRTWKLPRKDLPVGLRSALSLRDLRDTQLDKEVLGIIDSADIEKAIAESGIQASYNKTIGQMNKGIEGTLKNVGIQAVLSDDQKERISKEWTENLDLFIKDFSEKNILQLREKVSQNTASGQRAENLVKIIKREYGVTLNKAKFLARQETSLLMSKMRETRYTSLGMTRYTWRTSGDGKVRDRHKHLNGKVYSWSSPPIVDDLGNRANPGEDFNCRCIAVPILEEI